MFQQIVLNYCILKKNEVKTNPKKSLFHDQPH